MTHSAFGKVTAAPARAHGAAGALLDGGIRDSGMPFEIKYPVFPDIVRRTGPVAV